MIVLMQSSHAVYKVKTDKVEDKVQEKIHFLYNSKNIIIINNIIKN